MLTFTYKNGPELHYEVSGRLSSSDLRIFYTTLKEHYESFGQLRLFVRAKDFRGYRSLRAIYQLLRHEPALLWRVSRYVIVTGQTELSRVFATLRVLVPTVDIRVVRPSEEALALRWLRA